MTLLPCPGCSRHVRATEPSCPFCAHALPSVSVAEAPTSDAAPGPAPSRYSVMFGMAVGAIAVSTALLGSACYAYGAPAPVDADVERDDAASGPDAGR